ncbi:MAG: amino acid ABC transporter substrate-binding protein [Eggerthellaceae bacterium]|nr:amino acid ABC transporter substrate-binding protein [Eggerthellaceae bacterium]
MKTWKKILALAFGGALALSLVACGGSSGSAASGDSSAAASGDAGAAAAAAGDFNLVKDGTLTVITSADYPPFEYMEGNEIVGFDAALIREIGSRLGLEVEIQNQAFDTLVTAVAGGSSADVAISAITIDPERLNDVDFSESYYDSNLSIVVLKDSGLTAADANAAKEVLAGAAIGAQSGTSGEAWIEENLGENPYTPYQETPDLLNQLRTGAIQAAVYDQPVAEAHVNGEYSDCEILTVIPTGEQYGIAVNKDNAALTAAINEALEAIVADGTMDALLTENL